MENNPNQNFKNLANTLARIVIDNKIPLNQYKDYFIYSFVNHVKTNSLKGMNDCLELFHQIQLHQNSNLKLECGFPHCIECYYYFTQDTYFNSDTLYCTCMRKIVPKYRSLITQNYKRIQNLKVTCMICKSIKDEMNFLALKTHKTCAVCFTCIEANYVYQKNFKNLCINCGKTLDNDSEFAIRSMYEQKLSLEVVRNFYLENCDECQEVKDSRNFSEICSDKHKVCRECVEIRKKKKSENCFCGLEITIL